MKKVILIILVAAFASVFSSCTTENVEPSTTTPPGRTDNPPSQF